LIFYSCYAECVDNPVYRPWLSTHKQAQANPRNFATIFELDLQFKRMLWLLISDLLKNNDHNPKALEIVAPSPLLYSIISYSEFNTLENNNSKMISFTPEIYSPDPNSPNNHNHGSPESFVNQSSSTYTDGGDK
jgi:hypothetical protein